VAVEQPLEGLVFDGPLLAVVAKIDHAMEHGRSLKKPGPDS